MEGINFTENRSLVALLAAILPLFSFVFILSSKKGGGASVALSTITLSFLLSMYLFLQIWNLEPEHKQISWFIIGNVQFYAGVLLNNLSVLMMVLVTGISVLVHIYSREYMKNDPNIHRYWAYLGLFCFSMLGLVISDSLLLIYLFWELVGFSSYLLIGFWFSKHTASQAAKKAFIMNRIGDLGFLTGIMIIYTKFQTLDLHSLFGEGGLISTSTFESNFWISGSQQMPAIWLSIAGFAFFLGAMAKSAQFPLHTWLPDAMEGPTSVSSLIHAATMVAAGVFLIARIYPVFDPLVLDVMVWIGAFTAFMAATIALTQNDIKRILAYSTISQLGFMVMALGIGAYSESIFHLTTHAFFKCLLFLAAGSVIHQLHHYCVRNSHDFDYQDIRLMGGLRKRMPIAFWGMCIASAALVGLPLTSGFLSKDSILISAFEWAAAREGIFIVLPWLMVLTSWLTAFYIFRLIFKVFFSESREIKTDKMMQISDSPGQMTYVLLILSFFCTFIVFSVNPATFEASWLWKGFQVTSIKEISIFHWLAPLILNLGAFALILITYSIYVPGREPKLMQDTWLYRISNREWFFNEIYNFVLIRSIEKLSLLTYGFDRIIIDGIVNRMAALTQTISVISDWFDRKIIDGLVNSTGSLSRYIGRFFRNFQSGRLQHYLTTMLLVVLSFFILSYLI
ncbi:MAG: NADH-quinone oxidoreductase subunit L [Daejeonella sp.]|uniref:NADH-quinone oxidoreductase subunit L n=1 Tax=Daejeonella sp. TaxID=2805397 RepID=UPI0027348532|nr:NADH-quinone oxidoreductase subunit L [Daejeonella sp.]MDP3470198.1 NADH-quinone oxidoreductase subunit L [Daejeonella sp.]